MEAKLNPHIDPHRDDEGSKLGMWLFLFTELLLFGGLFLVYSIYRMQNSEVFAHCGKGLNLTIGTINTIILLTSSLTVAMSITAIKKKNKKLSMVLLFITLLSALAFLVNKYFEWAHKIDLGIYPGSEYLKTAPHGEGLFYLLYYFMTGLHAFHVIVGAVLLSVILVFVARERITHDNNQLLENGGLYWHLVDLIWIYLFPLFYLIH